MWIAKGFIIGLLNLLPGLFSTTGLLSLADDFHRHQQTNIEFGLLGAAAGMFIVAFCQGIDAAFGYWEHTEIKP